MDEDPVRDDFDDSKLNIHFQTLRMPLGDEFYSLTERPGHLRLRGSGSLGSRFHQSLIARRQQAFCYTTTTVVEFEPNSFQQMAGLTAYYDINNFYYLNITWHEEKGKILDIVKKDAGIFDEPLKEKISIEGWKKVYLRVDVDYHMLQYSYSKDGDGVVQDRPFL